MSRNEDDLPVLDSSQSSEAPSSGGEQNHSQRREDPLVAVSPATRRVYRQALQAARADIPVLLLGETGTGKDLLAQVIHRHSDRKSAPYLAVNLGSVPSELVAGELFGHEKGAFTGAGDRRRGVFEVASNGTIFLDEIDSLDKKVQVSLLRLLEQHRFTRLGGSKPVPTNARIIAASNANLKDLIKTGAFRNDLYYRLEAFIITLPPLSARPEDIPALCSRFIEQYGAATHKHVQSISGDALDLIRSYDWPGNIRELKNVIQRAVLVCDGDEIRPGDLPVRLQEQRPKPDRDVTIRLGTPLTEIEKTMLVSALRATGNNRKEAADLLGISRRAIYNKLQKFGLN
jgi:DNA-binding NtrC family response regulator